MSHSPCDVTQPLCCHCPVWDVMQHPCDVTEPTQGCHPVMSVALLGTGTGPGTGTVTQPRVTRSICSQTPMWWMANGVYWGVTGGFITWAVSVVSFCSHLAGHDRMPSRGHSAWTAVGRGPFYPYSPMSSARMSLISTFPPSLMISKII